jgi:hypothetical protein
MGETLPWEAPEEIEPTPPLPDDWTAPGVDPGLMDAIRRSIRPEEVAEIMEFHRTIHGGRA